MDVIHHGLYTPLDDVGSTGKGLANTADGAKMSVAALPRPRIVWVFQATIIERRQKVCSPSSYSTKQQREPRPKTNKSRNKQERTDKWRKVRKQNKLNKEA